MNNHEVAFFSGGGLNKTQLDSVSQRLFDSIKVIYSLEVAESFRLVSSQNIDENIELALKFIKPLDNVLARQQEMLITK